MSYQQRHEIMAVALGHLSQHHFVPTAPKQWKTRSFLAPGVMQRQVVYFPTSAKGAKYQADFQNGSCSAFKTNSPICKETRKNTGCHWFLTSAFFNPD